MSTEKFLVYFFLILFYAVYVQFSDAPERSADHGQAVASMPAPSAARASSDSVH